MYIAACVRSFRCKTPNALPTCGRSYQARLLDLTHCKRIPGTPTGHLTRMTSSTPGADATKRMATMLTADDADLATAGEMLRKGQLVSFPTETVYGLGANALDENAVLKIFEAKGRPLTDPLIVHVPSAEKALQLLQLHDEAKPIYKALADNFWPGPLTLVGRAHSSIPLTVTAGTGMVGIRIPNHPVARKMLEFAKVPVAAPSANRFGHVSPTTAQHVYSDLGHHDYISIIDGGTCKTYEAGDCSVGIESTVMKIDHERKKLVLFRRGGISEQQLAAVMTGKTDSQSASLFLGYEIEVLKKVVVHKEEKNPISSTGSKVDDVLGEEAPGQHLTHYAPDVPATLVRVVDKKGSNTSTLESLNIATGVIIDFNGSLLWLKDSCLQYRDLSVKGDMAEAASNLFAFLRWSETVEGATNVYMIDINEDFNAHAHRDAVKDRLFRAASGRIVFIEKSE